MLRIEKFLSHYLLCYLLIIFSFFQLITSVPVQQCTEEQTSVLIQFKRQLFFNETVNITRWIDCESDNIPSFQKLDSWKESSDCCSWEGIDCDSETGQVIGLDLSCSGLQGTINLNSTLFNYLSFLQNLNLSYNDIRLEEPAFELLAQNFTKLRELNLNFVKISSTVPTSLLNLSLLTHLELSSCGLRGEFPNGIFNFPYLQVLDLENNDRLTGHFPMLINSSSALSYLNVGLTNFSGELPPSIGNMKYLEDFLIFDCEFYGSIPASLGNLTQIQHISAYHNSFSGSLPSAITGFQNLKLLQLAYNFISGPVPTWVFALPSLEYLYIQHSNLTGHLGRFQSKSLTYIDMGSNYLHGTIPISSFQFESLTVIRLNFNNFSGPLKPEALCRANKLEMLSLSYNNLSGVLPECIGNFSESLVVLFMPHNNFSGTIPDTFVGKSLRAINLSDNRLAGPLPKSIANCRELEMLDLGENKISDIFPHWLGQLPKLRILGLQSNKLYGSMNDGSIVEFMYANLYIFDISDNELTGCLPTKYFDNFRAMMNSSKEGNSTPQYMWYTRPDGNYFHYGSMSVTMKGSRIMFGRILTTERYIDLSQNKFEANIPESVGKLHLLRGLNLSHNHFAGKIPVDFENLTNLEWLDLSSNELVGKIPQELTKLDSLQVIDLSWNQLTGRIPQGSHFDTFPNDSYIGNVALCGPPLSNTCDNAEPWGLISKEEDDLESPSYFEWKDVMIGYGCGLLVGLGTGYLMFSLGKPRWLVMIIEGELHAIKRRFSKCDSGNRSRRNSRHAYRNSGRRN